MQNPLENILEKEMDRREFIAHVGAGVLAVAGVGGLIKAFTGNKPEESGSVRGGGYGGGPYGR